VFLPIHTAGVYSQGNLECCSDYVVSSYTPTLSALRRARAHFVPISRESLVLLAAGASETLASLKMPFLKSVKAEIIDVALLARATDHIQVLEYGHTSAAKVHEMAEALPRADIVHLACHGVQDQEDPLKSGFCLGDGKLTVSKLMEIKLDRAFLAFLSACETAKGDQDQPDQAIHLAAAMLFCGFRSVVATMWCVFTCSDRMCVPTSFRTIWDDDGPAVARIFYKALLAEKMIDADAIAYALDAAVSKLRQDGVSPARWASFIHVGA
jgi:CHAT domain-containing protein